MAADQLRLTADERADLVAFLDGELPEERSEALAGKLTRCVSGRREVEALAATWELLDLLPRPRADDSFTERTITIAAEVPTGDDRFVGAARVAIRRGGALLAIAAVATLGCAIGNAGARWLWPDRTSRLARDLTIAEHLDDYRAAGSFEMLRLLDESSLFKEASD